MNMRVRDSLRFVTILVSVWMLTGCVGLFRLDKKEDNAASTPADPAPSIIVTGPAIASGSSATSFVYTVTYSDATTVNLTNGDITLGGTDTAGCNAVVTNGTTTSATVTVTGCTGDGTVNISIAADTAQDADGDQAPAYGPSSTAAVKNSFIVSFNSSNIEGGSSANTDVAIPLVDWIGYDFDIDWGDSSTENVNSPGAAGRVITHTYSTPGTYQIKMKGSNLPWLQFCSGTDKLKIVDVKQWGTNAWWKFEFMFANCKNVQISATDAPVLSSLVAPGFRGLFQNATSFNSDINHWDTSTVTDMSNAFAGATAYNKPLANWDVSNVTDMTAMFGSAAAFNQNISSWNTSSVTAMDVMFFEAYAFNQPLVHSGNAWNTSNVTSMSGMFEDATAFNQDISSWVFGASLTSMEQMFLNASSFNQNLSAWILPAGVNHNLFDNGAGSWVLARPTFP